ncbi:ankyrin repeat domain-containing protein [Tunturiibacter psychrotolerans]|uniref:ankyrin repeat domain-containing protein n=1 Tax=Tunturiibacter psychrotolerans TaxID=3069686 RepID=UPI003DA736E3
MGASFKGNERDVRLLLDNGANANAVDSKGLTSVMYAVMFGRISVIRVLRAGGSGKVDDNTGFKYQVRVAARGESHDESQTNCRPLRHDCVDLVPAWVISGSLSRGEEQQSQDRPDFDRPEDQHKPEGRAWIYRAHSCDLQLEPRRR